MDNSVFNVPDVILIGSLNVKCSRSVIGKDYIPHHHNNSNKVKFTKQQQVKPKAVFPNEIGYIDKAQLMPETNSTRIYIYIITIMSLAALTHHEL